MNMVSVRIVDVGVWAGIDVVGIGGQHWWLLHWHCVLVIDGGGAGTGIGFVIVIDIDGGGTLESPCHLALAHPPHKHRGLIAAGGAVVVYFLIVIRTRDCIL